jgi:hypothetical protein
LAQEGKKGSLWIDQRVFAVDRFGGAKLLMAEYVKQYARVRPRYVCGATQCEQHEEAVFDVGAQSGVHTCPKQRRPGADSDRPEAVAEQRDLRRWVVHAQLAHDFVALADDAVDDDLPVLRRHVKQHVEDRVVGELPQPRQRLQRNRFELVMDGRLAAPQRRVPSKQKLYSVTGPARGKWDGPLDRQELDAVLVT